MSKAKKRAVPLVVAYKHFDISLEPCPHGYYCPYNENRAIPCPPGARANNGIPRGKSEDCFSSHYQGKWQSVHDYSLDPNTPSGHKLQQI